MTNTTPLQRSPNAPGSSMLSGARAQSYGSLAHVLPSQLRNSRTQRYQGQDLDSSLSALTEADQDKTRLLYGYAKGIHLCWLSMREVPDWELLRTQVVAILQPPLRAAAKELGQDTMATLGGGDAATAMGKALHDLRGGALMSLQLYANMAEWEADPAHLRGAAYLARDQAKIMRNVLPDLDPQARSADEAEKPHFMQTVVEKWSGFRYERADQHQGQVDVHCEYDGLLASCCLEASAVDRVVYNYMNNAMRFSAGLSIHLDIVPIGENAVRWVVANPITADQAEWLRVRTGGDFSHLFRGGLTRGGNGLGLSNCADFVAAAFGLPDVYSALKGRYLGATVDNGWYVAWAHWPALYPNEPKQCTSVH